MPFKRTLQEIIALKRDTFNFFGAERISVAWETKKEIVAELLPEPLKPAKRPIATAFVANYPLTDFGEPYMESGLFLMADFNGEEGMYCLSMPVTDDMALIGGREYFGYPKKIGRVEMYRNDTSAGGWTERHGIRFMEIKARMTGRINHPDAMGILMNMYKSKDGAQALTVFNFKYFASADLTGFDFNPRLMREEVLFRPKTLEPCEVEIIFNKSDYDPWHEIEVVKMLGGSYATGDATMLPGRYVAETDPMKFFPFAFMKSDLKAAP